MAIRDLTSMISPGMRVSRSNVSSVPRQDPPVEEMRARSVENSEQEVRPQVRSESQSGTEARLEARDTYVVVSDDIPVAPPAPLKPDPIKPGEKLIWVIPSNSPLASELEPTGESIDIPDAAPQQQVAPALVRAEDPLTGALLSAGLGAGVGAGAKVLGSIGSKVAASAVGSGSKAGKVAAAVLKPVGGTTIRKVETSVAKATTPKIGGAVGSVMESAATPAKLPLNAATGIYAADVVGRVTAKDEQGNAPSAGEMGSRAAKIGLTEIVPFAAGAVVGGAAAGRVMQGVGTRRIESQFTRIPREDPVRRGWIYNDRQLREGRGRIYPEPSSSAARSGSVENVPILRAGSDVPPTPIRAKVSFPFSSDALSRVTTRNG
ncbi:MAG: hypothetical protein O0X93_01755, partial [Methanocorpusculum sp.]|nr:hypothetical protein [Methanocorpusculum sp.]